MNKVIDKGFRSCRFVSTIVKHPVFLAFSPEHLCSDLSRQTKNLLSLNWHVLKVLIAKFHASSLDLYFGSMLINLSCKSASKPLNAHYCPSARSHRGRHQDCAYTVFTRFWFTLYTNTARSTEAQQRLCSEALTSEVGLLQNFRAYKKWIPLSSNFWAIYSRL